MMAMERSPCTPLFDRELFAESVPLPLLLSPHARQGPCVVKNTFLHVQANDSSPGPRHGRGRSEPATRRASWCEEASPTPLDHEDHEDAGGCPSYGFSGGREDFGQCGFVDLGLHTPGGEGYDGLTPQGQELSKVWCSQLVRSFSSTTGGSRKDSAEYRDVSPDPYGSDEDAYGHYVPGQAGQPKDLLACGYMQQMGMLHRAANSPVAASFPLTADTGSTPPQADINGCGCAYFAPGTGGPECSPYTGRGDVDGKLRLDWLTSPSSTYAISNQAPARGMGAGVPSRGDPVSWESGVVTVMIRQVPRHITQWMLLEEVVKRGFRGRIDFLYLPYDFNKGSNVGYGFINFVASEHALTFRDEFDGSFLDKQMRARGRCLRVHPASVQGYDSNWHHFVKTKTGQKQDPQYSPLFFPDSRLECGLPALENGSLPPERAGGASPGGSCRLLCPGPVVGCGPGALVGCGSEAAAAHGATRPRAHAHSGGPSGGPSGRQQRREQRRHYDQPNGGRGGSSRYGGAMYQGSLQRQEEQTILSQRCQLSMQEEALHDQPMYTKSHGMMSEMFNSQMQQDDVHQPFERQADCKKGGTVRQRFKQGCRGQQATAAREDQLTCQRLTPMAWHQPS